MALHKSMKNNCRLQCLLIMYNHGSIAVGSFLFDDADQFKGFANRTVRIWPFWTLKMPHFKYIVILKEWKMHKSIWWKIDRILILASAPVWLQSPDTEPHPCGSWTVLFPVSPHCLQRLLPTWVFQGCGILPLIYHRKCDKSIGITFNKPNPESLWQRYLCSF